MFSISSKLKTLLVIYSLAAAAAVIGITAMNNSRLGYYRMAADYSSAAAFDETADAVEELSRALKKLGFATDHILGRSICSKAYAEAMSAEAALSVLPFSTQELEKLSAFLNLSGDYCASLLAQEEEELSDEQKQQLKQLSDLAADFSSRLRQLQNQVNDGTLLMDSMEESRGRGRAGDAQFLSASLLSYEQEFESPEAFVYDGQYSPREQPSAGELNEEEAKQLAAKAAGVEARELKEEYSYEGPEGRRCYSAGNLILCVSSRGLESMKQSRLIGSGGISGEEAREKAESFLEELGYTGLGISSENIGETLAAFRFAPEKDGALLRDDYISIDVALDDGSIYGFDASRYREDVPDAQWKTDEQSARSALPDNVEAQSCRKLIIRSPGGNPLPCWEFDCVSEEGERLSVCVSAESGKQCKIDIFR